VQNAQENTELDLIEELPAFFPATITRAETALSKYPVHNLSKANSITIHIHRKGDTGDADIQWSVSPSREYGEPRQLAYKVDTLVVSRRIDKAGRPIPRIIRLGSLRDLCQELSLSPGGENLAGLRVALLQNASAFITAKLTYRGVDGGIKKFEAGFTRYSVVFTGEEMPNGHVADAVHILLNEHYWKLLNKAQFRPLDYDYQKSLTPSAHRFYELVSYAMYGCLSRGQREARLLYSDYCLRAPQERYFDRARVQKQMYKLHKPHLDSEYIGDVRYEKTIDSQGEPDWEICYAPGKRAKAHFAFFRKQGVECQTIDLPSGKTGIRKHKLPARQPNKKTSAHPASPVCAALQERGVSSSAAEDLTRGREEDPALMDSLEWGDHLISQAKQGEFRNPAGFYIYLLKEGIKPPREFKTACRRAPLDAQRTKEYEREVERFRLHQAYDEYIDRAIRESAATEFAESKARRFNELRADFKQMSDEQLDALASRVAIADLQKSVSVMTFEQFCENNPTQVNATGLQQSNLF
jgi:hypothetical protein